MADLEAARAVPKAEEARLAGLREHAALGEMLKDRCPASIEDNPSDDIANLIAEWVNETGRLLQGLEPLQKLFLAEVSPPSYPDSSTHPLWNDLTTRMATLDSIIAHLTPPYRGGGYDDFGNEPF
jgi:hypothetical protein